MSAFPTDFVRLTNGQSVTLDSVPVLDLERFQASIVAGVKGGCRVSALFGAASPQPDATRLYAVLADDDQNLLLAAAADVTGDAYPSLTRQCAQVHVRTRDRRAVRSAPRRPPLAQAGALPPLLDGSRCMAAGDRQMKRSCRRSATLPRGRRQGMKWRWARPAG